MSGRSRRSLSLFFSLAILFLALSWVVLLPGDTSADSTDEAETIELTADDAVSTPISDVPTDEIKIVVEGEPIAEKLSPDNRVVTRYIPNMKVLDGAPPTVINLTDIFGETEIAECGTLTYELVQNKEKAATVSLEGDLLKIDWIKVGKQDVTVRVTCADSPRYIDNRFRVEVWQPNYWTLAFTVLGGLGIFLLGMKNMSEGLQAVAGSGLRRMISLVTNNRLMAVGVGATVTMLIQSSSITTVMVVGFVNSGMMTLTQAIGVIMGANIGTTITGWIFVLAVGKYGLPLLGFGAFGYLFSRSDRVRFISMSLMGLGMVFYGLVMMKDGFAMVKDLPAFESWFAMFSADTYFGVLKCALVGCILTLIVQSSSATLGITVSLAAIGVIPFETAAALILGENLGTTITAFLASIGTTVAARRAAFFHIIFNMLGVLWVTAIFIPVVMPVIKSIVGVNETTGLVENTTSAIALTHSLFNITNTVVFLPFVGIFAKLLIRIVPQKETKEKPHLTSLDVRMLETTSLAIEQSRVEVLRMGVLCGELADWVGDISKTNEPDRKVVEKTFRREDVIDTIQDEIVTFMTHMLSSSIPHSVAEEARLQLRLADEYESIGDYLVNILKSNLKLNEDNLQFSEKYQGEMENLHEMVSEYLQMISRAYSDRTKELVVNSHSVGDSITHFIKELREQFVRDMSETTSDPRVVVAFNFQLNAYRRVREHILNIAETLERHPA